MQIVLDDKMTITVIQETFNMAFNFLKMEFFEGAIKHIGNIDLRKHVSGTYKQLGPFRKPDQQGNYVTIKPEMTVSELEQQFITIYGLNVEIFRKSGNIWLKTTVTDGWTLKEQNRQGESITAQLQMRG
jgi:hypothetical protein